MKKITLRQILFLLLFPLFYLFMTLFTQGFGLFCSGDIGAHHSKIRDFAENGIFSVLIFIFYAKGLLPYIAKCLIIDIGVLLSYKLISKK
jgi:hypothetical protein